MASGSWKRERGSTCSMRPVKSSLASRRRSRRWGRSSAESCFSISQWESTWTYIPVMAWFDYRYQHSSTLFDSSIQFGCLWRRGQTFLVVRIIAMDIVKKVFTTIWCGRSRERHHIRRSIFCCSIYWLIIMMGHPCIIARVIVQQGIVLCWVLMS